MSKTTFRRIPLSNIVLCMVVIAAGADASTTAEPPQHAYSRPSLPATAHKVAPLSHEEAMTILNRYDADVKRLTEALDQRDASGEPTESSHLAAKTLSYMRRPEALPFMVRHITYGQDSGAAHTLTPLLEWHPYLREIVENHGEAGVRMIVRELGNRDDKDVTNKQLRLYAYAMLWMDGFDEEGKKRVNARLNKVEQKEGAKPVFKRLRQAIAERNSPLGPCATLDDHQQDHELEE
jgi:hypothetical protein